MKTNLTHENVSTEIILGFMLQVRSLAKRFETDRFVFGWDSRKSFRKQIFPAYKENRVVVTRTEQEVELNRLFRRQFDELRINVLNDLGFSNNFIQTGMEADDIVATIVQQNWENSTIIVTVDSDLYQVLNKNNFMWNPRTKKKYYLDNFVVDFNIAPFQWSTVKAIAGDTSDNINGIDGVGVKNAVKYLRGELGKGAKFNAISQSTALIERNLKLVKLPFKGTNKFTIQDDNLTIRDYIQVCERYGFKSLLRKDEVDKWNNLFGR